MDSLVNSIDYFASMPSKLSYRTIFGGFLSSLVMGMTAYILLSTTNSYLNDQQES
jgi:hypothetical protein